MSKLGRCVTVGTHTMGRMQMPSGRVFRAWCMKEYEAAPRRDGKYTWRLVKAYDPVPGNDPPKWLVQQAKDYAARKDVPYIEGVKQGVVLDLSALEILALEL